MLLKGHVKKQAIKKGGAVNLNPEIKVPQEKPARISLPNVPNPTDVERNDMIGYSRNIEIMLYEISTELLPTITNDLRSNIMDNPVCMFISYKINIHLRQRKNRAANDGRRFLRDYINTILVNRFNGYL